MYNLPEVALVKLSEARELAPNQPVILYGIAELRFQQGEFQQALPLYERLLKSERNANFYLKLLKPILLMLRRQRGL